MHPALRRVSGIASGNSVSLGKKKSHRILHSCVQIEHPFPKCKCTTLALYVFLRQLPSNTFSVRVKQVAKFRATCALSLTLLLPPLARCFVAIRDRSLHQ